MSGGVSWIDVVVRIMLLIERADGVDLRVCVLVVQEEEEGGGGAGEAVWE